MSSGSFASSPLTRLLRQWAPADAGPAPGADFAERLSAWVPALEAIGLQAAQQAIRAIQAPAAGQRPRPEALAEDVQRARSVLARAIAREPEDVAERGYKAFHERHGELQRQMELLIGPLRAHVREAAGRASARLRRLAALDATLEQLLAPREQALLAGLPAHLQRRFQQLAREAGVESPPAFAAEWRQALLAELELRLAPVTGLLDALTNEMDKRR